MRHTVPGRYKRLLSLKERHRKRSEIRKTGVFLTQMTPKKNGPFCYGEVDPTSDFLKRSCDSSRRVRMGRYETVCILRIKNQKRL